MDASACPDPTSTRGDVLSSIQLPLDIGFLLPARLLGQYDAHLGNGQSALLQAVKRSIQKTYATTESFGDGQVVVVNFLDGITFEILPAFVTNTGSWLYPNAREGGTWKRCDPRAEIAEIQAASDASNRNLKYLCRMMRIWRDHWSVPMSGILIDTLAYRFITTWQHQDKSFSYHDWMVRDFLAYLAGQRSGQAYWYAPGSNSLVHRKGAFERMARRAYQLAVEAIVYDEKGHQWSRRLKWRQIFGNLYPGTD